MWIFPLVLLIVFEMIADIFGKEWSFRGNSILWIVSIVFYIIGNVFWLFSLRNGSGLARGAAIFSVMSAILAIGIGFVYYKESVSATELAGILVGLLAIVLIFWNDLF